MPPAALVLVAVAVLAVPPGVEGTGHDAAEELYSTRLRFTGDGVPVVTVGLMDGQEEVVLTAKGGLRIGLSGPGRASVVLPAGSVVRVRVDGGVAGETRNRVVLEGHRGGDLASLQDARRRWEGRGLAVEAVELGGIIGFPSRLLDNRSTLLVEATLHATREAAEARAREVALRWPSETEPSVFAEPVRRPRGVVVATETRTGLSLRQDDLLTFDADDGGPIEVKKVEHGRGYAHHAFEDRLYHGTIVLALDPDARLAVVNRVSAELLLQGLVPAETFPTAPAAALDVQAISARGELLAKVGVRHLADPYLVCASQHCQVYSGLSKEESTTNEAVRRTRGLMVFGEDDLLVDSVYSASCGGHTEHNEHVWEGVAKPTLRGRADAPDRKGVPWKAGAVPTEAELRRFLLEPPPESFCGTTRFGSKVFRWRTTLTDAEIDSFVARRHDVGHVTAIEVLGRGASGRVTKVRFRGDRGTVEVGPELAVRRLLGNLRSGMFVVDRLTGPEGGRWSFAGGGWGHGVGMCQYGAIGMAERGKEAEEILRHYFHGAKIEAVY